jgi:hypothetical protein
MHKEDQQPRTSSRDGDQVGHHPKSLTYGTARFQTVNGRLIARLVKKVPLLATSPL